MQGSATVTNNFCTGPRPYTVYFDLVFDQAFSSPQVIDNGNLPNVVFLTFDTTTTRSCSKVAISWVSAANAAAT